MFRFSSFAAAIGISLASCFPAFGQTMDNIVKLSLRNGWTENGTTHISGLQIDLKKGWKTYWRQPGDVGVPPVFDWSGSSNLAGVEVLWPTPDVTWDFGARSLSYDKQIILPLVLTSKTNAPIDLNGKIIIGVCADVCIPVEMKLKGTVFRATSSDPSLHKAIKAQPKVRQQQVVCQFKPIPGGVVAQLSLSLPALGKDEHMAVELLNAGAYIGTPKLKRSGDKLTAEVKILSKDGSAPAIDRSALRTTVISNGRAVEINGCQAR